MAKTITAMHARKNFGQLLNEVSLLHESFIIQRANKPMAALVPIDSNNSVAHPDPSVVKAFQNLVKRIKGPRSKKLEKAIQEMSELLHLKRA
ncbi:MAG: type II toxin-antitoxin system Phd/YefM family antitoxin [Deltaproteobacteria bacterium]|nr:type II toxin-antitoxin system Phd/YefM family antitoxin [Deltaproteobacteria bacterium]